MAKLESAEDVKQEVLDFLAKMGEATWSSEIQKIKKSESVWQIEVKKAFPFGEQIFIEIDVNTGKVTSFEKK